MHMGLCDPGGVALANMVAADQQCVTGTSCLVYTWQKMVEHTHPALLNAMFLCFSGCKHTPASSMYVPGSKRIPSAGPHCKSILCMEDE